MSRIFLAIACFLSCLSVAFANESSDKLAAEFSADIWPQVQTAILNGQTATTVEEALWVGRTNAREYMDSYCTAHTHNQNGPFASLTFECLDTDGELASITNVTVKEGRTTTLQTASASPEVAALLNGVCAADPPVHKPGKVLGIRLHCTRKGKMVEVNLALSRPTLLNTNQ